MVAIGVFVVAGGIIFEVFRSGLIQSAKNSAVNMAHAQARQALDRLVRDIHAAVSVPVLVDTNRVAVAGAGPAPGVSFLLQSSPVCLVAADAAATQNSIQLTGLGSYVPAVGQRLIIPSHQIEADITGVSGNTLTLATNLGVAVTVSNGGNPNRNIIAYVADLVTYVQVGPELRYYPNAASSTFTVVARYLTNPLPFGAPFYAQQ
jgi:hypothetical protein